jgi:dephospho-CoA kinase
MSGASTPDRTADRPAPARPPRASRTTDPLDQPFLIGLTGPIGCGKSTVGKLLGRLGGRIVDADQVSRSVMAPGEPVLDDIRARFGEQVMSREGALDRQALANVVFHDPVALRDLEAMTHPLIRARIDRALAKAAEDGTPFAVLEAIKLIESEELARRCDEIWLVDCPPDIQRERLIDRGMGGSDMDQRLAIQATIREHATAHADRVIDTRGTIDQTRELVEDALAEALARKVDIIPFGSVER